MPYHGEWNNMPKDLDELADRIMAGYNEGLKVGRQEGAAEVVDQADEFLKKKYFDPSVKRGTPFAEGLLDLVRELIYGLRHGDLGKVAEKKERKL